MDWVRCPYIYSSWSHNRRRYVIHPVLLTKPWHLKWISPTPPALRVFYESDFDEECVLTLCAGMYGRRDPALFDGSHWLDTQRFSVASGFFSFLVLCYGGYGELIISFGGVLMSHVCSFRCFCLVFGSCCWAFIAFSVGVWRFATHGCEFLWVMEMLMGVVEEVDCLDG